MEPTTNETPLIAIVGETASGKSAIALQLAQHFDGEIIAADSRTVYKGMDIGTAKPTPEEQGFVRHHLLDIAPPNEPLSAAAYKVLALKAIEDISSRGKLPILVGGTGLYIDAVLFDYTFTADKADQAERERLRVLSVEQLQQLLIEDGIPLPNNERNPRHLIRQLETKGVASERSELRQNTLVLGVKVGREILKQRIAERVDAMITAGLEAEVRQLVDTYGWDYGPLRTIGYQEFALYFAGEATIEDVKQEIVRATIQYAKRQRTWFRRNKEIKYICNIEESVDLVTTLLNK